MPDVPKDPMYSEADPDMEFRVVKQGLRPGRVKLGTLAVPRLSSEAVLSNRIEQEVNDRKAAVTAEAAARSGADAMLAASLNTEAQTRAQNDTTEAAARASADATLTTNLATEATTRANADTALQAQITALAAKIVPLSGTLTLAAGLTLLQGKSTRTVAVAGIRVGDNLVVTPNAALPANLSMSECYCTTAGTLSVVLINSATLGLSIGSAQSIPLGIIALRP